MFLARCNAAHGLDTIGYEFDSVAAVVAGGTSLTGGRGGIPQTIVGVTLITIVRNGLNLLGVNSYLQMVIIGCVLVLAYCVRAQKASQEDVFLASVKDKATASSTHGEHLERLSNNGV